MSGDDELRRHFDALRETDLADAPTFAELWERRSAPRPVRRRAAARWLLAAGVGTLAAASLLGIVVQRRREAEWVAAARAISRWQPPTDALLTISRTGMAHPPATLGASVLDSIIPASRED